MELLIIHSDPVTGFMGWNIPAMNLTRLPGETDLEYVESIARKDVAVDVRDGRGGFTQRPFRIINTTELPDPTGLDIFREAWRDNGTTVVCNMAVARKIHWRNTIRKCDEECRIIINALNEAILEDDKVSIAKLRTQLVHYGTLEEKAPAKIRDAKTVEELKALTLDELLT